MNNSVCFYSVVASFIINAQAAVLIDFTNQGARYDGNVSTSLEIFDSNIGEHFQMIVAGSGGNLNSNLESLGIDNDTLDWHESITQRLDISFDIAVKVNSIDFNKIGASVLSDNDKAMVTIGNNAPVLLYTNAANFNGTTDLWTLPQPMMLEVGESILIEAAGANTSFGLQKLNITAIPEPSSCLLLALCGLHVMTKRKRSATSF